MSDNTTVNAGSGGDVIATDDIAGVKYQRMKLVIGADGVNGGDVASGNPLPVTPGSAARFVIQAAPATLTSISGTVTAGGTAQNAAAANANRQGFWIQNLSSGDLWINTLATAAAAQPALKLTAGTYYEAPLGGAGTGAISIYGATTGQAFAGREW